MKAVMAIFSLTMSLVGVKSLMGLPDEAIRSEIEYLGVISNANHSILDLSLDDGFQFEQMDVNEFTGLISDLEGLPKEVAHGKAKEFRCINYDEKKVYVIHNSIVTDSDIPDEDKYPDNPSQEELDDFFEASDYYQFLSILGSIQRDCLDDGVRDLCQKMRLFKEGGVSLQFSYCYLNRMDKKELLAQSVQDRGIIDFSNYIITESEKRDLTDFIRNVVIPFKSGTVQLALENFDLSYYTSAHIHGMSLPFLVLMNGIEALYNPGFGDLRSRTSRNCAVLLGGSDIEKCRMVSTRMKGLYKKRALLLSSGNNSLIKEKDVLDLRQYLRESIIGFYKLGLNESEIRSMLDSKGYGQTLP
ncbi:hypothetical protein [Methanomassiliicoccus luminyensis]|uniref:hypothetical protein n=1 Tax=Methanomassiliicoccus luminyensis TaxID=1080712 RepID=UPI0011C99D7D|nr:hypothetical protein [Methanomassiliicoccus luminyensis]